MASESNEIIAHRNARISGLATLPRARFATKCPCHFLRDTAAAHYGRLGGIFVDTLRDTSTVVVVYVPAKFTGLTVGISCTHWLALFSSVDF